MQNQREISNNKVRRLLWPFEGGKCGKGGKWFKVRERCIKESRVEFPDEVISEIKKFLVEK